MVRVVLLFCISVAVYADILNDAAFEYKKGSYKEALELFKKACDLYGMDYGCFGAGSMYDKGEGAKKDYKKACEYYKKGCEGGNAVSCNLLAAHYQNGEGVKRDLGRAAEYYKKACDVGSSLGCENYTRLQKRLR